MNPEHYNNFQALIFDLDGTLVDSGQLHEVAWTEALNEYDIPLDRSLMRSLAGVPTYETVQVLCKKFGDSNQRSQNVNAWDVALLKQRIAGERLLDYVKPTPLAHLAEHFFKEKPMAIGTGALTKEAENILRACGLDQLMCAIVGADKVINPKPAPDTFLRCAELLSVTPQDCVVFEDSPLGLKAARSAGMSTVDVIEELGFINDYFL